MRRPHVGALTVALSRLPPAKHARRTIVGFVDVAGAALGTALRAHAARAGLTVTADATTRKVTAAGPRRLDQPAPRARKATTGEAAAAVAFDAVADGHQDDEDHDTLLLLLLRKDHP